MRSMDSTKIGILACMLVVLGVPFLVRPESQGSGDAERRVIIITPHNEQIRTEFARGFASWHEREFGETAEVVWVTPGGTSEIRRQLQSIYTKALQDGQILPSGELAEGVTPMPQDIIFGGGTYEHGEVKKGVTVTVGGEDVTLPMSIPLTYYTVDELAAIFGENRIGPEGNEVYDPERFWVGTATSGFGIVFNRDVLVGELGLEEPRTWQDFSSPELRGWVALADPRQSGSVATLYDSILNNLGWEAGWRQLREMCANARYFSNSSPKVPLDVSQGQACIGVTIDFYGRYQAQAVMREGETPETSRVGYVDPAGQVFIDPDPISILRGGPDPEMANRFVAFVLSDEGQALWQFGARGEGAGASLADAPSTWGPERFELRRMPVRRDFIEEHFDRLIDRVDPFAIAAETPSRGWRSSVSPMMACFGIDTHRELIAAWEALHTARADASFPESALAEMERLFYAMPTHTFPDGTELPFTPEHYRAIRNEWRDATERRKALVAYTRFFKQNYERVVELAQEPAALAG
ncbi:MAG: extracellular solute-binding protein [Planctomycetota bacterium]